MIPTEQIQMPVANCCIMTNVESQGSMSTWSLLLRKEEEKNHSKSRTYFLFNHSYPIFINIADIKSEMLLCCGSNYYKKNWPFCAICWSWFLACNLSRFCCFDSEQLLISMVINRPRKPLKNMYHALLCSSLCLLLQVVETQFIFQRFLFRCIS